MMKNNLPVRSQRSVLIDIARGIGIFFVVLGHSGFPYTRVLYLFHVSLFFVISGFLHNLEYSSSVESLRTLLWKRVKSLYFPYVLVNILFIVYNNLGLKTSFFTSESFVLAAPGASSDSVMHLYSTHEIIIRIIKVLLFSGGEVYAGATWFLRILFIVNILYAIIEFILRKLRRDLRSIVMVLVSLLFVVAGYHLSTNGIRLWLGFPTVLSCFWMFGYGGFFRRILLKFINNFKLRRTGTTVFWSIIALVSFGLLLIIGRNSYISLGNNLYPSIQVLFSVTILGFMFVYAVSWLLEGSIFGNWIAALGKRSMAVLCLHFLSMRLANEVVVLMESFPAYYRYSFPVISTKSYWLLYTIVGIIIPLLFSFARSKLWGRFKLK
jgi:fucose 4-O-acetylase-like acetyltransferase